MIDNIIIIKQIDNTDSVADVMREVCHDVQIEPHLLPIDNDSEDNARLDKLGRGVWAHFDLTFLNKRVTHPNCRSNAQKSLPAILKQHKSQKKAKYNDRILNVEKGNFTLLVFLTTGRMSPECKKFWTG